MIWQAASTRKPPGELSALPALPAPGCAFSASLISHRWNVASPALQQLGLELKLFVGDLPQKKQGSKAWKADVIFLIDWLIIWLVKWPLIWICHLVDDLWFSCTLHELVIKVIYQLGPVLRRSWIRGSPLGTVRSMQTWLCWPSLLLGGGTHGRSSWRCPQCRQVIFHRTRGGAGSPCHFTHQNLLLVKTPRLLVDCSGLNLRCG